MYVSTQTILPEGYMLEMVQSGGTTHQGSRCPEMQQFTASVRAYLDFTGVDYGYVDFNGWRLDRGFTLLCVLSGEAFATDKTMCDANPVIAQSARVKRLFEILGYEYSPYTVEEHSADLISKEEMKQKVIESLYVKKSPVIINRWEDCPGGAIVVGYEGYGETLIRWNYHVFDFSPNPQPVVTTNTNWYETAIYVCFIGNRIRTPELPELYRNGLQVALQSLADGKSKRNDDFYERWIRYFSMSEDDYIQEVKRTHWIMGYGTPPESLFEDDVAIREELVRTIDPLWCAYTERRYYAKHFMRQAKDFFPQVAELLEQTAQCFEVIEGFMDEYVKKVGHDPVDRDKLRDMQVRSEMKTLVAKCRREEENSIDLLEAIVKTL